MLKRITEKAKKKKDINITDLWECFAYYLIMHFKSFFVSLMEKV